MGNTKTPAVARSTQPKACRNFHGCIGLYRKNTVLEAGSYFLRRVVDLEKENRFT